MLDITFDEETIESSLSDAAESVFITPQPMTRRSWQQFCAEHEKPDHVRVRGWDDRLRDDTFTFCPTVIESCKRTFLRRDGTVDTLSVWGAGMFLDCLAYTVVALAAQEGSTEDSLLDDSPPEYAYRRFDVEADALEAAGLAQRNDLTKNYDWAHDQLGLAVEDLFDEPDGIGGPSDDEPDEN